MNRVTEAEFRAMQKESKAHKEKKLAQLRSKKEAESEEGVKRVEELHKALEFKEYEDARAVLFEKKSVKKVKQKKEEEKVQESLKKLCGAVGNIEQLSLSEKEAVKKGLSILIIRDDTRHKQIAYALGLELEKQQEQVRIKDPFEVRTRVLELVKIKEGALTSRLSNRYAAHQALWNRRALSKVGLLRTKDEMVSVKPQEKKLKDKLRCVDYLRFMGSYLDVWVESEDNEHTDAMKQAALFHALNHILLRNTLIARNDVKYKALEENKSRKEKLLQEIAKVTTGEKEEEEQEEAEEMEEEQEKEEEQNEEDQLPELTDFAGKIKIAEGKYSSLFGQFRDQGFTTGKVLILAPFKIQAFKIVKDMLYFLNKGTWKGVTRRKKFKEDFREEQHYNDCFALGIKLKASQIRLYENFNSSDLILASPLGLRTTKKEKREDYDFLSSIEMVILYGAQVLEFQNPQIVEEVLCKLNHIPKQSVSFNDINRIKPLFLDDKSESYRQLIMLSEFRSLDQLYLFSTFGKSQFGHIEIDSHSAISRKKTAHLQNCLQDRKLQILFRKLIVKSVEDVQEARFQFFTKTQWKRIYEEASSHTLIVCASYLDFLRLKRFFSQENQSVAFISQYSDKGAAQRARSYFESGRVRFLLFTERAFFFDKIMLRVVDNLLFYTMPSCPEVFIDMIDLLNPAKETQIWKYVALGQKKPKGKNEEQIKAQVEEDTAHILSGKIRRSIMVLYSKYDEMKLERLFSERMVERLVHSSEELYCVGG